MTEDLASPVWVEVDKCEGLLLDEEYICLEADGDVYMAQAGDNEWFIPRTFDVQHVDPTHVLCNRDGKPITRISFLSTIIQITTEGSPK